MPSASEIFALIDLDAAVGETVERMTTHAHLGSMIAYEYGRDIDAEDPDEVDPREGPGFTAHFTEFVIGKARALVAEKADELATVLDDNDGTICVYRGLSVDRSWIENDLTARPIGVCWSWDDDFAIAHCGECDGSDMIDVRVVGLVRVQDIDWTETVTLAASDVYVTGEEREIRLNTDALVEIAGVDWRPEGGRGKFERAPHLETKGIVVRAGGDHSMVENAPGNH
jgi:hypothetical protein